MKIRRIHLMIDCLKLSALLRSIYLTRLCCQIGIIQCDAFQAVMAKIWFQYDFKILRTQRSDEEENDHALQLRSRKRKVMSIWYITCFRIITNWSFERKALLGDIPDPEKNRCTVSSAVYTCKVRFTLLNYKV